MSASATSVVTHRIRQSMPVRALLLAALLAIAGVVILVIAHYNGRQAVLEEVAASLLVLGMVLLGAAWWSARRGGATITTDAAGYRIVSARTTVAGTWAKVSRVSGGSTRITIHRLDSGPILLSFGRGERTEMDALAADIAARLDADRGYGR